MKDFQVDIDLIEDFLNDKFSQERTLFFEERLKTDSEFKNLFNDYIILQGGIERAELKAEIINAQQTYFNFKWLKTIGISIASIVILMGAIHFLRTRTTDNSPESNKKEILTISKDSSRTTDAKTIANEDSINIKVQGSTLTSDTIASREIKYSNVSEIEKIQKQSQKFKIAIERDTIIEAKEGTRILILANSLQNKATGKRVDGTIEFEITEYYKLSDIIMANLSTTSNGDIIETGGMVNLKATQAVEELELVEGKAIQIEFKDQARFSRMKLFKGEWEGESVNWILDDNTDEKMAESKTDEVIEESIEVPYAVVEEVPIFPGCENTSDFEKKKCTQDKIKEFIYNNINMAFVNELSPGESVIVNVVFKINQDGKVQSVRGRLARLSSGSPLFVEEAEEVVRSLPTMLPGKQRGKVVTVPYSLPIIFEKDKQANKVGILTSQNFEVDSIYTYVRSVPEEIREVLHNPNFEIDSSLIKEWESYKDKKLIRFYGLNLDKRVYLKKPLFELANSIFKKLPEDSVTRGGHIIRIPWDSTKIPTTTRILKLKPKRRVSIGNEQLSREEFETRLSNNEDDNINSKDLSNYAFRLTELGWVNCDRFVRWNTPLITLRATNSNTSRAEVSMVFKSVKSVVKGEYAGSTYVFGNIPKGEMVSLVAIQRRNGKLMFGLIETVIDMGVNPKLDLREVTLGELKEQLIKLDN